MAIKYWCGDPFVPTMVKSSLAKNGWQLLEKYDRNLNQNLVNHYQKKIFTDFLNLPRNGLRKIDENEHFGRRIDIDVIAEKENEIFLMEVKTKIYSQKQVYKNRDYSRYHFDRYPDAVEALLRLPTSFHEKLQSSCELLKYCLKLTDETYKEKYKKIGVLIPFYINKEEPAHIIDYLKRLQIYSRGEHGLDIDVGLWQLNAKINKRYPSEVKISQVWETPNFKIQAPTITKDDILAGHNRLSETNHVYRKCVECSNRKHCESLMKEY